MDTTLQTELFACIAKEVTPLPLSCAPVLNVLLRTELIRGLVAIARTTAANSENVIGQGWWQKIKIMRQT